MKAAIAAHTGIGGHRGKAVTLAALQAHFFWNTMEEDVNSFVGTCLHCLATAPGITVPRPLGSALHAVKPNHLIHFDYCYISEGQDDYKYVLVIKDDHSGYVWLKPTKETTAVATADILIDWFSTFGIAVSYTHLTLPTIYSV